MNFIQTLRAFFTQPGGDPVTDAAFDPFSASADAYNAAYDAIEPFTRRANHRFAVTAIRTTASGHATYGEAVAGFTDPADFSEYTEAELDAHTEAIETLTASFDKLSAVFAGLNVGCRHYTTAAALFKATCDSYAFAADAYSNAVHCAMITALQGNLQTVRDEFQAILLRDRAANPQEADPSAARARAAAFKIEATERAGQAKALEEKAKVAETKAGVFRAKAKSAADQHP